MSLARLHLENLRNLKSLQLNFHPKFNIIDGPNGSGKTSLLEAIYLLSSAQSFRSREIVPLLSYGQQTLTLFGQTFDEQVTSIQKSKSAPTIIRLNGSPCTARSELACFLPTQIFYQDIFQIIDSGPPIRRAMLDWGMFHVEHFYLGFWKEYQRALKQRNVLLKQNASQLELLPWNQILSELAHTLDKQRKDYCEQLNIVFKQLLNKLTDLDCNLIYYRGWDNRENEKPLTVVLVEQYASDIQKQYTQYGAHHADLVIEYNGLKAKQYLSRGQQKIILFALKIAQTRLVEKNCVFLCDDLPSELDNEHFLRLINLMQNTRGQFFISGIHIKNMFSHLNPNDYFAFELGPVANPCTRL